MDIPWDAKIYQGRLHFYINKKNQNNIQNRMPDIIEKWYKAKAKERINERIKRWIKKTGLKPTKIAVRELKRAWAHCSSRNTITFNYRLIMAPLSVIDYVILHELCHLKHMNHSKKFWTLIEVHMPQYLEKKKWLAENGQGLSL